MTGCFPCVSEEPAGGASVPEVALDEENPVQLTRFAVKA